MQTLDFGAIMERDGWFDEYELYCPFCQGDGQDEDGDECEQCTGAGVFEVLWNTAFSVDVPHGADREEARKTAWDAGFCLIEHNGADYLLMGSCGQDNTWVLHSLRWELQRYLEPEAIAECLHSGGYVFVPPERRREMIAYFRQHLPTPDEYARNYARDMARLDDIAADTSV